MKSCQNPYTIFDCSSCQKRLTQKTLLLLSLHFNRSNNNSLQQQQRYHFTGRQHSLQTTAKSSVCLTICVSVHHTLLPYQSDQFSMPLVALSSEALKIRPKLSSKFMTELFSIHVGILFVQILLGVLSKGHVKLLWVLFLQTCMRPLPSSSAKNPTCNV